jgi:uncharacterized membrane protein YqhA
MSAFLRYLLRAIGLISSVLFLLLGIAVIAYGAFQSTMAVQTILNASQAEERIISEVLKGIDLLFLGVIILIIGVGIYELFVSTIERLPAWLEIKSFDHLKTLLIKSSITVIAISFTGKAVTWDGTQDIVYYGLGIAAIIAALAYFIKIK